MADNNAAQIAANINKVAQVDLPNKLAQGLENACLVVERAAKSKTPPKAQTGNLRSSITHKVSQGSLEGVIGSTADYAPYVELGTGEHASMGGGRQGGWWYVDASGEWHHTFGSRPYPFLKPAMDENLSAIMKCFEGLI